MHTYNIKSLAQLLAALKRYPLTINVSCGQTKEVCFTGGCFHDVVKPCLRVGACGAHQLDTIILWLK